MIMSVCFYIPLFTYWHVVESLYFGGKLSISEWWCNHNIKRRVKVPVSSSENVIWCRLSISHRFAFYLHRMLFIDMETCSCTAFVI